MILIATPSGAFDLGRSQEWEERMLEAINAERAERGLRPYRLDRHLEEAAADHSRRMAKAGRLR